MFESLLSTDRLLELRQHGALVFDVDDTLLMRRQQPAGRDQIYPESESARMVPELLHSGLRVGLITGHGWMQLAERLVEPLVADLAERYPANSDSMLSNLVVYANRGAMRVTWHEGCFVSDAEYGREFMIDPLDRAALVNLLSSLADRFMNDVVRRPDWYHDRFKNFPFDELPPKAFEREGVILGLRPLPSDAFFVEGQLPSPRQLLASEGIKALKALGLDRKYDLGESGRSTLEIIKRSISKSVAFRDLIAKIAYGLGCSFEMAEQASIYVGDEFGAGGNDRPIPIDFPGCLCFSVSPESVPNAPANVKQFSHLLNTTVPLASELSKYIVKVLVDSDISANLTNSS